MVDFSITVRVTTSAYTFKYLSFEYDGSCVPISSGKDVGASNSTVLNGHNSPSAGRPSQHMLPGTFGWYQGSLYTNANVASKFGQTAFESSIYGKSTGNPYKSAMTLDNGEGTGYGLNFMGWNVYPCYHAYIHPSNSAGEKATTFTIQLFAPNTSMSVPNGSSNYLASEDSFYETTFYIDSDGTTFNGNAILPINYNQIGATLLAGGAGGGAGFSK